MSTTAVQQEPSEAAVLTPVLSEKWALGLGQFLAVAWFGMFFLYLNYIPLFHSDLWAHVLYGEWILDHRAIPAEDPFLPLAEGMRVVDTAWLAQAIFAQVNAWWGPEWLSNVYALVVLAEYVILARTFFKQSGHIGLAIGGTLLVLGIAWTRHAIIRPEIFGGLCFAVLAWLVVRWDGGWQFDGQAADGISAGSKRRPWGLWIGVGVLFALWANLHGSFLVGLIFLGCHLLGRTIEVAWRERSLKALFKDERIRFWLVACEIGTLATLVNPYGLELIVYTLRFSNNPNLKDVLEWYPTKLIDAEGILFTLAIAFLIVIMRHSRRRMRPVDVILVGLFAAVIGPQVRMIGWFAPVLTLVLVPHLAGLVERWHLRRQAAAADAPPGPLARKSHMYSLAALAAVWIAFALSHVSTPLLGHKGRAPEKLYSRHTPLGLTAWLREHPPKGLVWAPQWWGDWILWDGPPDMQLFMTTNLHLIPQQVWRDYLRVGRASDGWERTLERYNVSTLIVHKELQRPLANAIKKSRTWKIVYEDDLAVLLEPAGRPGASSEPPASRATARVSIPAGEPSS
jgi:hypothetical protein